MSALGSLTRRLSSISISKQFHSLASVTSHHHHRGRRCAISSILCYVKSPTTLATTSTLPSHPPNVFGCGTVRFQSSKSKGKDDTTSTKITENDEWIDFQKSIQVKGFDTGQQMTRPIGASMFGSIKKSRGGKQARKREERLRERMSTENNEEDVVVLGGGHFPALRYSEEETQRLLDEAYAGLPKRDGKRGTRNLKRQRIRFRIKRAYDKKRKQEKLRAHYRRMEKLSVKYKDIRAMKEEGVELREQDQVYQKQVLERWMHMFEAREDTTLKEEGGGLTSSGGRKESDGD